MRPHVLVVEDDFATREALRKILEAEGCTVEVAIDGEKAVGCLAHKRYDVIVLDLALPKLSGTDVMEYIASTNPAQLSSIVVVTGLEVHEIRKLFPAVRETLSKPVMPTRLIASVRRCLGATAHPNGLSGISVA
jgi:two-component system, OmpR family, alkaline phosphatase synthesis response regulator PhoP